MDVIVEALEVQTSLAPISTVTYWTPAGSAASWTSSSATFAPVRAVFHAVTVTPGWAARMRRRWLGTLELVPVAHEYAGQSDRKQPHSVASKPRVIESPTEPTYVGYAGAACAAPGTPRTRVTRAVSRIVRRRIGTTSSFRSTTLRG